MFWRQKTPQGCGRRFRKKFKLVSHSLGGNMVLASQNTSRCLENKFNAFSSWIWFFKKMFQCRSLPTSRHFQWNWIQMWKRLQRRWWWHARFFICGVQNPSTEFGWQKAEKTGENCRKKRKRAAWAKGGQRNGKVGKKEITEKSIIDPIAAVSGENWKAAPSGSVLFKWWKMLIDERLGCLCLRAKLQRVVGFKSFQSFGCWNDGTGRDIFQWRNHFRHVTAGPVTNRSVDCDKFGKILWSECSRPQVRVDLVLLNKFWNVFWRQNCLTIWRFSAEDAGGRMTFRMTCGWFWTTRTFSDDFKWFRVIDFKFSASWGVSVYLKYRGYF